MRAVYHTFLGAEDQRMLDVEQAVRSQAVLLPRRQVVTSSLDVLETAGSGSLMRSLACFLLLHTHTHSAPPLPAGFRTPPAPPIRFLRCIVSASFSRITTPFLPPSWPRSRLRQSRCAQNRIPWQRISSAHRQHTRPARQAPSLCRASRSTGRATTTE